MFGRSDRVGQACRVGGLIGEVKFEDFEVRILERLAKPAEAGIASDIGGRGRGERRRLLGMANA
jgi:hypothetical protein